MATERHGGEQRRIELGGSFCDLFIALVEAPDGGRVRH